MLFLPCINLLISSKYHLGNDTPGVDGKVEVFVLLRLFLSSSHSAYIAMHSSLFPFFPSRSPSGKIFLPVFKKSWSLTSAFSLSLLPRDHTFLCLSLSAPPYILLCRFSRSLPCFIRLSMSSLSPPATILLFSFLADECESEEATSFSCFERRRFSSLLSACLLFTPPLRVVCHNNVYL